MEFRCHAHVLLLWTVIALAITGHRCIAQTDSAKGELQREYERLVQAAEEQDSLLVEMSRRQVRELEESYQEEEKKEEIRLLEKDRQHQNLLLNQQKRALILQQMYREKQEREMLLLEKGEELTRLDLQRKETELSNQEIHLLRLSADRSRRQDTLRMQSLAGKREALLRYIIGGGVLAVLLFIGGGYWNHQNKKAAVLLREKSAKDRARLLEAITATEAAEADRRKKVVQQEFSMRLIAAQEEERSRIAGALHDGISQDLIIMKFRAVMAQRDPTSVTEHLQDIIDASGESIEEVRRISRDLCPSQLERVGLTGMLVSMLRTVRESSSLTVEERIDDLEGLFTSEEEIGLYRVVKEAVNNILKHAEASRIELQLQHDGNLVRLMIHDDGTGFDPEKVEASNGEGLGLRGMNERARMLDGIIRIESAPGEGTTLWGEFPVRREITGEKS